MRVISGVGQNRIYTPYLTVYLVISLPKIPYLHRIYMVLANPSDKCWPGCRVQNSGEKREWRWPGCNVQSSVWKSVRGAGLGAVPKAVYNTKYHTGERRVKVNLGKSLPNQSVHTTLNMLWASVASKVNLGSLPDQSVHTTLNIFMGEHRVEVNPGSCPIKASI